MKSLWKSAARLAGVGLLSSLLAMAQQVVSARPGAVNYVEGTVTLNGSPVTAKAVGSTEVGPGQVLQTGQGKAEVLLTPGVFVRLGENSALQMIVPKLTDTQVALQKGEATVEVDEIEKENHLDIADNGMHVVLEQKGVYELDADQPSVRVYDGKVMVREGDREIDVGKGKMLSLASAGLKAQKFDRKQGDELYAWSKLRSEYMAQANLASAQTIITTNPWWYYGTGWYWNPWFASWAFVPGGGFFYNPFGFGFYSPAFFYYNPGFFYGYRGFHGGFPGVHGAPVPPGGPRGTPRPAGGSGVRFGGLGGSHAGGFAGGAHFGGGARGR